MPKKTEQYYDSQGRLRTREVGQDEDVVVKAKLQDASGLAAKTGTSATASPAPAADDRPKASDYKDNLPGLQEAWRKYRAKSKKP